MAISDGGVLVFAPGGDAARGRLAWIDRQGGTEYLPMPERVYGALDLSPDGHRIAVHVLDVRDYIQIFETGLGETVRIQGRGNFGYPYWSRDGERLAYQDQTVGANRVLFQTLNSNQPATVVLETVEPSILMSWGPNDSLLVQTGAERRLYPPNESPMPVGLVFEPGAVFVDLDPSGEWVAVNGRSVEVLALDGRQKLQVSPGFGMEARWCSACSALFYRNGNQIFSVGVQFEPTFAFQPAELAFEIEGFVDTAGFSYDALT